MAKYKNLAGTEVDDSTVVCSCVNLSIGGLRDLVAGDSKSFEDVLEASGAGRNCTACLLDLEYYSTQISKDDGSESRGKIEHRDREPLRRRLFRLLDRMSPMIRFKLREYLPVFAGSGIRQHILVANDSLMYDGELAAPAMDVTLIVRDASGAERHRQSYSVEAESALDVEVSEFLDGARNSELTLGSVEILRKVKGNGYRGTSRPQMLLEGSAGSCAVHGLGSGGPSVRWYTFYDRSDDDRQFFCILNNSGGEITYEIDYPFVVEGGTDIEPRKHLVPIPPWGARLHEYRVASEIEDKVAGKLVRTRFANDQNGSRKIFLLCADKQLSRFSIDHASG